MTASSPRAPHTDGGLQVAVCAVTTTKRRRFLWAAWWTAPPRESPFRPPDAHAGGARTHDEAFAAAEKTAGRPLTEIEGRWARAWMRVLEGQPAWPRHRPAERASRTQTRSDPNPSVWATLGLAPGATAAEIKRAYHARARATHPDHGGNADEFRQVQRAFAEAKRRNTRRPRRP